MTPGWALAMWVTGTLYRASFLLVMVMWVTMRLTDQDWSVAHFDVLLFALAANALVWMAWLRPKRDCWLDAIVNPMT